MERERRKAMGPSADCKNSPDAACARRIFIIAPIAARSKRRTGTAAAKATAPVHFPSYSAGAVSGGFAGLKSANTEQTLLSTCSEDCRLLPIKWMVKPSRSSASPKCSMRYAVT